MFIFHNETPLQKIFVEKSITEKSRILQYFDNNNDYQLPEIKEIKSLTNATLRISLSNSSAGP